LTMTKLLRRASASAREPDSSITAGLGCAGGGGGVTPAATCSVVRGGSCFIWSRSDIGNAGYLPFPLEENWTPLVRWASLLDDSGSSRLSGGVRGSAMIVLFLFNSFSRA